MPVLFAQNPRRERLRRVIVLDRHHRLQNNRPGIETLVHEMHRAARKFRAVFERLPLRFESRKRRQQRRMNVQDAVRKRANEIWRKQSHVPGQADELNAFLFERRNDLPVVHLAFEPLRRNRARRNSTCTRPFDSRRVLLITQHDRDFGVWDAPRLGARGQRLKIRASPRNQHANALFHGAAKLA